MPHLIHVIISSASFLLFVVMAELMIMADMELNPLSTNYLAVAHSKWVPVGGWVAGCRAVVSSGGLGLFR